jgi:class 3 adenylate cyclase/DNA-binding SARP family transcriptional activator
VQIPRAPSGGAPSPRFGLSLLGGFELTGPDGVVDLPSKKLAGLLAYLACTAPRPQSRERLSALLWGSHFDAQAKQNLRQALFRLRKILGEDALQSDGEVVSLNAVAVRCDVSRFEALVHEGSRDALSAATDLYRGRFIDDVTVGEEGWNEWLTGERERLLQLALGAMIGLAEQELAAGRAGHALKAGQRAIGLNNMREDAHRLIVRALAATGRKAEALRHYQNLVALLKHELNTGPDAATRSLAAELRTTEPTGRSSAAEPALPPPDRPSIAALPVGSTKRDSEEDSADTSTADDDLASPAGALRSAGPERRQLTIMVCSMVDSVSLSAHLDPEDMHDLIAAFHKAVTDVVSQFDGFVAQYLGDGVLVYFGYPAAREHDAEQAMHAGLGIVDAVGRLRTSSGKTLQASVGIATGLVVVGEPLGPDDTQQRVAIGEAPNVAAHLQVLASPGKVVIASSTHRLVGRMFDCRALPAVEVKGLPQPVEAWQVRGDTPGVSRFDARRRGALPPLVGRQEQIELLQRRWDQSKLGEGRVVLLSGEPGIGKSRLTESLRMRLLSEQHECLRYFCSPHHTHSPLHPFVAQLERAADFEPGSGTRAKLDRIEALLKPTAKDLLRDVMLMAELLSVPTDGQYPALAVSPQQKREMTLTALLDQLDGVAAQRPVLIIFEDVHWIDPTSLDLLNRMVARAAGLPVLLVITFRPELQPTWVGEPHVAMLPLSRLGRRDSASIIAGITDDKELPAAVVEQVLARADGVPLFIEELTSTLIESGVLRRIADGYALDGPLPQLAIPTTLQASLVERLDRLASVRDVAQIGAAIGREFSHELMAAVSPLAPMDLEAALARLIMSGLISRHGTPPLATYAFKHALVQDAAYATMLQSKRRQLHSSIAKALVEGFPVMAASPPDVVARHYTEAGLSGEAIRYWVKAGRLAHAQWANREAAEFFEQALHVLETQPESRETLEQAIDIRFDLKTSLLPLGAFDRIITCLREAEAPARKLDDQSRLGHLFVHMCQALVITGRSKEAIAFGQDGRSLAESLGEIPLQVTGNLYLATAYLNQGDFRQAENIVLKALRLLVGELSRVQLGFTGFPAVMARTFLTGIFAEQGDFEQGIAHGEEGIRLAEALDHPYSLASVCWSLAYLRSAKGEHREAIKLLQRGMALARDWGLTYFSTRYTVSLCHAYALSGQMAECLPLLDRTVDALGKLANPSDQSGLLLIVGDACVVADRVADAIAVAERALTVARGRGQRAHEARALRLLGDVAARRDCLKQAEGHYRDALLLAEELGMRPLIAHCHAGLGSLYRRTGAPERSQEHFAVAKTMYRDMEMTRWLEQAEAELT